jgi:hypothetical protein
MNGNTIAQMTLAIAVVGALPGCSTSAHRTGSYNPNAAGYGVPTASASSGSGIVEAVQDVFDVIDTIVGIAGPIWGMQQYEKMNDWGMAQYEAMNDQLNNVYSGNVASYRF